MKAIRLIASIITDDPNVIHEEALANLNATEISQEANKISGDENSSAEVEQELKKQQEREKAEKLEKKRIIKPQVDKLNTSLSKLGTGIRQGAEATSEAGNKLNDLDTDMTAIKTMMSSLSKSI